MVKDIFGSLLEELGKILEIEDLHPDRNNACLIKFPDGFSVQLEINTTSNELTILSNLGEIPAGKYRENIFREALKANGMPYPINGIFCYSKKADNLVMYERIPLQDLSGDKINVALTPFLEKGRAWKEAIVHNEIPVVSSGLYTSRSGGAGTGMLGLK